MDREGLIEEWLAWWFNKQVHLQWELWGGSLLHLITDRKWCLLLGGTWLFHRYRKILFWTDCVSVWVLRMGVQLAEGKWERETDRKRETTNRSVKKEMGQYFPSLSCQDPVSCSCGLASTYATRWESRRGASFAFLTRSSVFAITMPLLPNTHSVPQEKKTKNIREQMLLMHCIFPKKTVTDWCHKTDKVGAGTSMTIV